MNLYEAYPCRYETHCHDDWCSACATRSPMAMAEAYWKAGFTGMVFTNHFLRGNTAIDRSLPWEEKIMAYWNACQAARDWARGRDFHVLFGLEHAYGHGKEVLTYGIGLDFLLAHPDIDRLPLADYARLVHEAGGFLSQAHPYRQRDYIDPDYPLQPECLDSAEVYNHENTEEENARAAAFAREHGLRPTSGCDAHGTDPRYIGKAGVAFRRPIETEAAFAQALREGDYRLIVNGETV